MWNLILVAFLEPVALGGEFPSGRWPLHITLVKFDVGSSPGGEAGGRDEVAARVVASVDGAVKTALGTRLTIGDEAGFGLRQLVPVNVVEPHPRLQALHESLLREVQNLGAVVSTPAYTLQNYRPHVSHQGDSRPHRGDAVVLDRVALVDMAPDGDRRIRRVLELWTN
ncbi:2'-5' RNA ligase family protein [Arthrobacter rhizosphaerae]|uniref:2'-5' RNA ligase family protein n=1 Tax=Arthrobacter rhizosphaerae TaxID=2855490 RepID=UPI001FF15886|nr:2'-5' RNA ligase family protein [Arthrobacter rhizosphaerae]